MASNTGKDQPPPYKWDYQALTTTYSAEPSATPKFYRNHSTLALQHLEARKYSIYTTSKYQKLTLSVMVFCHDTFEPIVLGIDETYGELLDDFHMMLADPSMSKRPIKKWFSSMNVVWERVWEAEHLQLDRYSTLITKGNITAMLHLLKSRNGKDYIELS